MKGWDDFSPHALSETHESICECEGNGEGASSKIIKSDKENDASSKVDETLWDDMEMEVDEFDEEFEDAKEENSVIIFSYSKLI